MRCSIRLHWLSRALFISLLALFVTPLSISHAQSTMPNGWQNLSAGEFAQEADSLLSSSAPPTGEHLQEVVRHAWNEFLNDEQFVTSGNWIEIVKLIDAFASRRSLLISDQVTAEQVDAYASTLNSLVSSRLESDSELVTSQPLYEVDRMTRKIGLTNEGKSRVFTAWLRGNDWKSLELNDHYNLYSWAWKDSIDRRRFSARWTGSLTAPSTGKYTLRQVQQYKGPVSQLKVWIDGQPVLDSTKELADGSQFASRPVLLTEGRQSAIRVDLKHDVSGINKFGEGAPMVVLTWESDRLTRQIIPTTAYMPPAEFAPAGANGLRGEYFADLSFAESRSVRLDGALDLVWSWPPIATIHEQEVDAVLDVCKSTLLDEEYLTAAANDGDEQVFEYLMWRIAYRMTATERLELVQKLRRNSDVLAAMTPRAMGRLMQAIYMLPGKEHLELLGEWALARSQPRCRAGEFPGWKNDSYQALNTDFYWLMGLFLQGPYAEDVQVLWDNYLVRPDGECNLVIAYATAFTAKNIQQGEELLTKLKEQIDDTSLTGDQLATWYIARAFAKSALRGKPQPLHGFSDLEGALITADSSEYSFWALQEMVARLSSLDKGQRAKDLIELHGDQFTLPEQQAAMTRWIAEADDLESTYAAGRDSEAKEAQQSYLAELKRRRQRASGGSSDASRYDALIEQVRAAESAQ